MPIYRDKKRGCFVFDFSRTIGGQRVRAAKQLPRTWNQAQADAYDRQESARLYAIATGVAGPDHLIDDAVALYLKNRVPQLKHGRDYALALALLAPYYTGRPLTALSDVCKAIRLRSTKDTGAALAPATIMNRIRYLSAACRYAWRHHGMGQADPAAGVVVPTVNNQSHDYLTRAEMLRLARACQHRAVRAAIRIAFYTGMRKGEVMRARVVGTAFVLDDTKNGDPRIIPIHPKINSCLGYTWPSEFTIGYHFNKARQAIGMRPITFHKLRHGTATALLEAGADPRTAGALLGHKSAASMKRYQHHSNALLAGAVNLLARRKVA